MSIKSRVPYIALVVSACALALAAVSWRTLRDLRSSNESLIGALDTRLQDLESAFENRERDIETLYSSLDDLGRRLTNALAQTSPWIVEADVRLSEHTQFTDRLHKSIQELQAAEVRHSKEIRQMLQVLGALRAREPMVTVERYEAEEG